MDALTLYLVTPLTELTKKGGGTARLDCFTCRRLQPGQTPSPKDFVATIHGTTVDRQERRVPKKKLVQYDVFGGFDAAYSEAAGLEPTPL